MCVSTHMCRHTQGVHGNTELPFNCAANQYRSKNKVYLKKKKKRVSRSVLREFSEGIGEMGGYSREKGT